MPFISVQGQLSGFSLLLTAPLGLFVSNLSLAYTVGFYYSQI